MIKKIYFYYFLLAACPFNAICAEVIWEAPAPDFAEDDQGEAPINAGRENPCVRLTKFVGQGISCGWKKIVSCTSDRKCFFDLCTVIAAGTQAAILQDLWDAVQSTTCGFNPICIAKKEDLMAMGKSSFTATEAVIDFSLVAFCADAANNMLSICLRNRDPERLGARLQNISHGASATSLVAASMSNMLLWSFLNENTDQISVSIKKPLDYALVFGSLVLFINALANVPGCVKICQRSVGQ